jgi:spore germination cell wall hydrolase CwlJ-like protein
MLSAALMCLALNVYHEARSEPVVGQYAVAHVTINRVQSNRWPNDVCKVVKQGYRKGRHRCQFSWYCDGKSDKPYEELAWAKSLIVADNVLSGRILDITYGATHYHARYVRPYWSKKLLKTVAYGSHKFYK